MKMKVLKGVLLILRLLQIIGLFILIWVGVEQLKVGRTFHGTVSIIMGLLVSYFGLRDTQ